MSQDDVTKIRVENFTVGIIGLKRVMEEMAEDFGESPDEEVQTELLNRIRERNYIPGRATDTYAKALLREFKKFLGKPYEEKMPEGIQIKVLGPGCPQCDRLEHELMAVMTEMNLMADLEHVRDPKEIGKHGVMGTPALIINGVVKSVGKVPTKNRLMEWLKQAQR